MVQWFGKSIQANAFYYTILILYSPFLHQKVNKNEQYVIPLYVVSKHTKEIYTD